VDITERKRIESELEKYREHLEEMVDERTGALCNAQEELVKKERLATLGQLTATVSHELRNPLGAMRMSLYTIENRSDKFDRQMQRAVERVDRNIDRCDQIINELLDFTRVSEAEPHIVRLDEWLESLIDDQSIPEGVEVEKNLSMGNIKVAIDAYGLYRAVVNVVDNACQAMLEDEQSGKARMGSRLGIKTGGNTQRLEITISDTGTGMAEDILEKAFEPLFSTKSFGVGLGLPSVRKIMEQHKGGIEIETKAGQGTRITLWLPGNVIVIDKDEVAV
jgi:signal transduction histidine kinase